MKPKHFKTALQFQIYILECAIRDRAAFKDAMKPHSWSSIDEESQRQIDESDAEIEKMSAMKRRLLTKL